MSGVHAHNNNIRAMHDLIRECGPDHSETERERLLWLLVGIHAGALTPPNENEKRGVERVLAILDRKLGEGGGIVGGPGSESIVETHNSYYRGRWAAFCECAIMLRSALRSQEGAQS